MLLCCVQILTDYGYCTRIKIFFNVKPGKCLDSWVPVTPLVLEGSLQLRCNWGPRIKRISLQYHMSHHAPSDPKPWLLFQANTYTQWVVQYCVHRCGSGPYIACDSPISRLTVWREHTCRLVIGLRSFRHYPGSESNPRPCDCKTCALIDWAIH